MLKERFLILVQRLVEKEKRILKITKKVQMTVVQKEEKPVEPIKG